MSALIGPIGTVVNMNQALYGNALGNPAYAAQLLVAEAVNGQAQIIANYNTQLAGYNSAALATTVMNNLFLTEPYVPQASVDALNAALAQLFDVYPTARGQIISNVTNLLANLENDPLWGQAAVIFNAQAASNYTYSNNPANTNAGNPPLGATYTLTTDIDIYPGTNFDDVYNASLGTLGGQAVNTLQNFDSLDGAGGENTLEAVLNADSRPIVLDNIQNIVVSAQPRVSGSDPITLNLINAPQAETIVNLGSSEDLVFSNLANFATDLQVVSVNDGEDTTFVFANPADVTSVDLLIDDVQNNTTDTAEITINGVETIDVGSIGAANAVTLNANAATTVNILATEDENGNNIDTDLTLVGATVATTINAESFTARLLAELSVAGTITGGTANDVLYGSNLNDSISGGDGSDYLSGRIGNDTISGGAGNNTIDGGLGDDSISAESGNDSIVGGAGNDNIAAGSGNNTINAGDNDDTVTAGDGNDSVDAGSGNDNIQVGAGANTVVAGEGDDYVLTTTSNDSINAGDGNDTVISGGGSDTITAGAGEDNIDAGGSDDRIIFASDFTTTDTVNGGLGTNTLVVTAADAENYTTVSPATVTNIQILEASSAGTAGGNLNVAEIASSITTVNLTAGSATGAYAVTMNTGASTLNIGASVAATDTLTVAQAGTAAAGDSITINNTATTGDIFSNVTSTGIESVTLNTGSYGVLAEQEIPTLTINASTASSNTNLTLLGNNAIDISTALVSNTTGRLTVDANNLLPQIPGITTLDINAVTLGTAGTLSVIGSSGDDAIAGATSRQSTIDGGLGNDTIIGNSLADSLVGGAGADSIVSGGGNDTVSGGFGADTIDGSTAAGMVDINANEDNDLVIMADRLSEGDVVKGGFGTDTLSLSVAGVTTVTGGVSEFEVLTATGSMTTQDMTGFSNTSQSNNWTTIEDANGTTNGLAITNAGTAINALKTDGTSGTVSLARAAAGTNTLRVDSYSGAATVATLTVNDEENLTIGGNLTITTLNANSATGTLNLDSDAGNLTITTLDVSSAVTTIAATGDNTISITNAITDGTGITTITSALSAGAGLRVNASTSTQANGITFTGSSAASVGTQEVITAASADTIVANNGRIDVLTLNGNDNITGSSSDDTIDAGGGDDIISAAAGTDIITGGTGVDTLTLTAETAGTGNDTIYQGASDSEAATDFEFAGAQVAAGDTMTFENGVDVINGFTVVAGATTGGDILGVVNTTTTSLIGATVANLTGSSATFIASGNYNTTTGVFTITADGVGADTMILQALQTSSTSDNLTTNQSAVILRGVVSTALDSSNFTLAGSVYTVVQNTTVLGADGTGAGSITGGWTAASLLADGYTAISGDRLAPYSLNVDMSSVSGNQTFTLSSGAFTATGTVSDYETLNYLRVGTFTLGNGTNTFTTNNLTTTTTVDGGSGADTLVLTSAVAGGTIDLSSATDNLVDFEDIDASASTASVTATLVAGSTSFITSAFSDTINFANATGNAVTVNGAAAGNGDVITMRAGHSSDTVTVTGLTADIDAYAASGALASKLNIALGNAADDTIAIELSSGDTTITGGGANDVLTVDASNLATAGTLTLGVSGTTLTDATTVNGVVSTVDATYLDADLVVNLVNDSGNSITVKASIDNTTVSGGADGDSVTVDTAAAADGDLVTISGDADYSVTNLLANLTTSVSSDGVTAITMGDGTTDSVTLTVNGTGAVTVANGLFASTDTLVIAAGSSTGNVTVGDATTGFSGNVTNSRANTTVYVGNVSSTISSTVDVSILAEDYSGADDTLTLAGAGVKNITTGTDSFTVAVTTSGGGAININAGALAATKIISATDTAVTGPNLVITNLDLGDVSAATYAGNMTITGGAGVDDATIAVGQGTSVINFASANLSSSDAFTKGTGGTATLNITGNTAVASTALNGHVNMNTITFANTSTDVAYSVDSSDYTAAGTYTITASSLTSGGLTFSAASENTAAVLFSVTGGAGNDSITGSLNADTLVSGDGSDTVDGGAGADNISTGANNDIITGGLGNDVLNPGTGNDVLLYTAATFGSGAAINTYALTTNFVDTVSGFEVAADSLRFSAGNLLDAAGTSGYQVTLSTTQGNSVSAGASTSSVTVAANASANLTGAATNFIKFTSVTSTSFSSAIGTASLTVADLTYDPENSSEGVLASFYDDTNDQAVFGYIQDITGANAITSADRFVEVVRIGMTSTDYTTGVTIDTFLA